MQRRRDDAAMRLPAGRQGRGAIDLLVSILGALLLESQPKRETELLWADSLTQLNLTGHP